MRDVELIGAAIGEGAPDRRCRAGPAALRRWGLGRKLSARGRLVRWSRAVRSDVGLLDEGPMAVVAEFSSRLAHAVDASLAAERLPVVVGGDHSCAIGTWSAVAARLRPRGPLGLLWVDAHLDSHTPETSESQMPHGMPLAALLGHGPQALTAVGDASPKLDPRHVVVIGARSWESGEAALLERLGVRVMHADEVSERGFAQCVQEARARVCDGTAGYGISFDLDALDPVDAPGIGSPVDRGIRLDDAVEALHGLALDPRLVACELVEYNPALDPDKRTASAAEQVLGALVNRRGLRAGQQRAASRGAAL